ncbi:hypothetical protein EHO60_08965 [Leptospira fletcheri]|uniref:Lipoprotein n=1 Tax=Leptospira fletcheri TaxID=2484981 RepID=A0A4R9GI16_9LEPT|nr:hypothetical protein [Leptospira fletcheri]TGK12370.1 hypothetical protein EHO60_08965 [Leptospira fletcheri]
MKKLTLSILFLTFIYKCNTTYDKLNIPNYDRSILNGKCRIGAAYEFENEYREYRVYNGTIKKISTADDGALVFNSIKSSILQHSEGQNALLSGNTGNRKSLTVLVKIETDYYFEVSFWGFWISALSLGFMPSRLDNAFRAVTIKAIDENGVRLLSKVYFIQTRELSSNINIILGLFFFVGDYLKENVGYYISDFENDFYHTYGRKYCQ